MINHPKSHTELLLFNGIECTSTSTLLLRKAYSIQATKALECLVISYSGVLVISYSGR